MARKPALVDTQNFGLDELFKCSFRMSPLEEACLIKNEYEKVRSFLPEATYEYLMKQMDVWIVCKFHRRKRKKC